ncbi:hypothetical protein JB92DRAFT_3098742 [Gautieria morchelliformis]|nr:hypothetical protein JB92DRAFT_3098742 [Gautieria morchelliformis]
MMPGPSNLEDMEDPVLSPHFLSQGEDTSTSSSNSSSQHSGSPRNDWMLTGSVWDQLSVSKPQNLDDLNFNTSLNFSSSLAQNQWPSMDMDTDISAFLTDSSQQFTIDPSTLQFEGAVFSESSPEQMPAAPRSYDSGFQFTLSQPCDALPVSPIPFQLPTPKPSSLSSRSVSPALSKPDSESSAGVNPNDLSLLTHISQKAREAAGITLAVPVDQNTGGATEGQTPITPVSAARIDSQAPQPKLPIPRLRPTVPAPQPLNITGTSQPTPPSSQAASSPPPVPQDTVAPVTMTKMGRPKTSHTTIERRYRTNLNARILALRRAVPALRILEKNTATQTQGKGLTGAHAPKWDFDDVVNERGYVDGVKAAKKNSKGVVLGKAVEYIRALKRRETRLKREAKGLRTLLSGLVGGPELLREWEKEWRERFGGEEADEVGEDAEDNEDGDADGDDGDDAEDGDSDDEDGRAKKRARVEKRERKVKPSPAPPAEKRKRGRPRKNPVSETPVTSPPHLVLQPPDIQDERQPPKYLLAAFLLFSFFNSNTPASSQSVAHEGTVLSQMLPNTTPVQADLAGWNVLQVVNMVVSLLLLLSLAGPYLPKRVTRLFPDTLIFASLSSSTSPPEARKSDGRLVSTSPTRDVEIERALLSGDERALRRALGADGSLLSVVGSMGSAVLRSVQGKLPTQRTSDKIMWRQDEIGLRGWRKLCQVELLRGKDASCLFRVQAYLSLSSKLPPSASPSDNITLALLARPFAASIAAKIWEDARRSDVKTSSETLVLGIDVDEAGKMVSMTEAPPFDLSNQGDFSPVHCIAAHLVLARTNALAAQQFVSSVSGQRLVDLDHETGDAISPLLSDNKDAKTVVAAGRELGGPLAELTHLLDKIDRCPAAEVLATLPSDEFEFELEDDSSSSSESVGEGSGRSTDVQSEVAVKDTRLLLLATLLYRRIFPAGGATQAHVLSPPPSPSPKNAELQLALRRALASRAFDASPDTEDARDQVVDILAETRRGRSGSCLY